MARKINKPAAKKVVKKYGLAGYNQSSLAQAPQAGYYLGKSATDAAQRAQGSTYEELAKNLQDLSASNREDKQTTADASRAEGFKVAQNTVQTLNDVYGWSDRAKTAFGAGKAAKETADVANAAKYTAASAMADEVGVEAATAAKTGAAIGEAIPGLAAGALTIGGMIVKNSGNDHNMATYGKSEKNKNTWGTIMQDVGTGAGMGSLAGPWGTAIGAVAGLGYGIYDAHKQNKNNTANATNLSRSQNNLMNANSSAFVNSRLMDTYKGGNQMARYGGAKKYVDGGLDFYTGDPKKKKPGEATTTPIAPPPTIDWSNPGANLSLNGVPAPTTPPPAANPNANTSTRQYQAGNRILNVTDTDPTLEEGYEAPVGNAETNTDQVSLGEAGKFIGNAVRGGKKYELNTIYEQFRADHPGYVSTAEINQFVKDNGLKFQDFQDLDRDWRGKQWKAAGYGYDGQKGKHPVQIMKGTMGNEGCEYGGTCHPGGDIRVNPAWTTDGGKRMGGYQYEFGGTYNDLGGTRYVNGGKIKPIPNSHDVAFEGDSHEEGGIKLDKHTEVEGGETATNLNGKQYFFSRVLKTPEGPSYAEAHKNIASSTSLDPISKQSQIRQLARQQEEVAGRDPKQIARYGGVKQYDEGGINLGPNDCLEGFHWDETLKDCVRDGLKKEIENLDLSNTWMQEHPGVPGGVAQLLPIAYAIGHPYQRAQAMSIAPSVGSPKLGRVNMSGEIEDARRQQNSANRLLQNMNIGPGKIAAMMGVAAQTNDQVNKISRQQNEENRSLRGKEAELGSEISARNAALAAEASKTNMMAEINQNQYEDERNLAVRDALGKGLAGISMDQRKLDMQYKIARSLDPTGAFNRYEILDKLRELAKTEGSPIYGKKEKELQQIASILGYNVVAVDKKEEKKFGGFKGVTGKKYTSRLGQLATAKNTAVKKSI